MKQDQPPRTAEIQRKTAETDITLSLTIDGSGTASIDTGVGFLDHMLTLFSVHGSFDLNVSASGDLDVDDCGSCGRCLPTHATRCLGLPRVREPLSGAR